MRLIDANVLGLSDIEIFMCNGDYKEALKMLIDKIERAPTIEERKKGKWIRITQGATPEKYMCPFCHRKVETYSIEELLSITDPFCHCGADMRGEQDG